MRLFAKWMLAFSVLVGSWFMAGTSHAALVTLDAASGLNIFIAVDTTEQLEFVLPSDLASINSMELDFRYDTPNPGPATGTASLEFFFVQDVGTSPVTAFAIGGIYGIGAGETAAAYDGQTLNTNDGSFSYILPFLPSTYQFGTLSATVPWAALAGSNLVINFYNGGSGGFTNVSPEILRATLKLNYNVASSGAVPEPSTLAIALVGLAGWRGRRMLRRS
ncbi:MAG: PEP-CTERM sorting domain-containing protein [Pirellulaceae bacterium]